MADLSLFTFIGETVTNATNAFVVPAASNLMFKLQMIALAGVTLYITVTGYAIATGSVEEPFWSFVKQCLKIGVIAGFALNADEYQNHVVATINGLETGLSDALNANRAAPSGSIYQTLDALLNKGFQLAATCLEQANKTGWDVGAALNWFAAALFISVGSLVFALIGGVNIIIAKFSLAIMIALGPFFILCLMFPITAKFFDSWLGQVLNYVFTSVILTLIMAFGMVAFDHFVTGVNLDNTGDTNPYMIGIQVLGLTVALGWIAMQASGMASGLAGGVSMSALSLRQITSPARTAGKVASAPLKFAAEKSTRYDMAAKQNVTASRLKHFAAGNTMWNPAYRQHTLQNIGKNWGPAQGGDIKGG